MDFDERVELIEGRIEKMGWNNLTHSGLVAWLSQVLRNWNQEVDWGIIFSGDVGIRTKQNPDSARGRISFASAQNDTQRSRKRAKLSTSALN